MRGEYGCWVEMPSRGRAAEQGAGLYWADTGTPAGREAAGSDSVITSHATYFIQQ